MPTKSNMWNLYTPLPLIPIYSILVGSSYFRMCVLLLGYQFLEDRLFPPSLVFPSA